MGNLTLQRGVLSQVDLAHAPLAYLLQYAVMRYRLTFQAALRIAGSPADYAKPAHG
jgi:hypothetical protein